MKKILRRLALFSLMASAIVSITSCTQSQGDGENPRIELQSYSYDVISEFTEPMSDDTEYKYSRCIGSAVLPTHIGNRDITFLRDSLCNLADIEISSDKIAKPMVSPELKLTDLNPDSIDAPSFETHILDIVLTNPRIMVWRAFSSVYMAYAAHPYYGTGYVNYDISGNRILQLSDLMVKNYEVALTKLIREELKDRDDLLTSVDEIEIPSQFRIDNGSIHFLYSIYEIAPFSSGEIEVTLYYYQLEDLLSPEGQRLVFNPYMID